MRFEDLSRSSKYKILPGCDLKISCTISVCELWLISFINSTLFTEARKKPCSPNSHVCFELWMCVAQREMQSIRVASGRSEQPRCESHVKDPGVFFWPSAVAPEGCQSSMSLSQCPAYQILHLSLKSTKFTPMD